VGDVLVLQGQAPAPPGREERKKVMAREVKKAGSSAWEQRNRKLHGSTAKHGMAKNAGTLQRVAEKPKGSKKP
jgi:hypothetical protein